MTTPTWERAKESIRAGDTEAAIELVDKAVGQWRSLQEYSINWITSTLSFIADGRYDEQGGTYRTLQERAPRTFNRDALPVYCAHCSVNNEIQPLEWGGTVTSVEHPPTKPGERCVHHIYKDPAAMPAEAYT